MSNSSTIGRKKASGVRGELRQVNLNAAGIDLGSLVLSVAERKEHYVAVGEDRDEEPVRTFGCFTPELENMARWLKECGIETVAMEATGVYWVPVFQVLESRGDRCPHRPGHNQRVWLRYEPLSHRRALRLLDGPLSQEPHHRRQAHQPLDKLGVVSNVEPQPNLESQSAVADAANALRLAAQSLHGSQSALGAFYRRMRARLGVPKAITATAHKLPPIIYRLLKHGELYVAQGLHQYEQQYRERLLRNLSLRAEQIGLQLLNPSTGEIVS